MRSSWGWGRRTLALACLALVGAPGCVAPAGTVPSAAPGPAALAAPPAPPARPVVHPGFQPAPRRATALVGKAWYGGPLVGATVRLQNLATGQDLGATFSTQGGGLFAHSAEGLPDRVLLVATGGAIEGVNFTGELRGLVDLREAHGHHTALGGASSVEAALLQASPQLSRAEAQSRVAVLLGLPQGASPMHLEASLDAKAFGTALAAHGGWPEGVAALAAEAKASPIAGRPMALGAPLPAHQAPLTQVVAKQLATTVLSGAQGPTFGRYLQAHAALPKARRLNQAWPSSVPATRAQVEAGFNHMSIRLDGIQADLNAQQVILSNDAYNQALNSEFKLLMSTIRSAAAGLSLYAQAVGQGNAALAAYYLTQLQPDLDKLSVRDLQFFHDTLMGTDGGTSLIKAYNHGLVVNNPVFYSHWEAQSMQQWWEGIDAVRATLVHLLVEKMNADPAKAPPAGAMESVVIDPWLKHRIEERPLLRGMVAGTEVLDLTPFRAPLVAGLNYVPEGYVYQHGASVVWSSRGVIRKYYPDEAMPLDPADVAAQVQSMATQGRPPYMWRKPSVAELQSLLGWPGNISFVSNRLSKAPFRQFPGMGAVASSEEGTAWLSDQVLLSFGPLPNSRTAIDWICFDGGREVYDVNLNNGQDSTACIQYFVSPYDANSEPHWW